MQLNGILKFVMLLFISSMFLVQCKKEKPIEQNETPIANAGVNQTISLPRNVVTLDGSASNDPDGMIKIYKWAKVTAPMGDTSTITNSDTVKTTVTGLRAGNYSFKLTVTDNNAASNSTTITVIVNVAGNQPPVAKAGANQTIILPVNTVKLDGSASYDPENNIASYEWTKISTPMGDASMFNGANQDKATVTPLIAGNYSFKLTVTDNKGAFSSDTVNVTVNKALGNQPPVANAGVNQTISLPTNMVALDGSASYDSDGSIKTYKWSKIIAPIGDVSKFTDGDTDKATVTSLIAGTYTFQLTVTDNNGASNNATVNVIVNKAAGNQPPVANAGADQTITLPTSAVKLDGSASYDPDGTIKTYKWTEAYGGKGGEKIETPDKSATIVSGLVQGEYAFKLTVTDDKGFSTEINVNVTVEPLSLKNTTWENTAGLTTLKLTIAADESMKANVTLGGTTRTNLQVDYGVYGDKVIIGSFEVTEAGTIYKYDFEGNFNTPDYTELEIKSLKLNDMEYLTAGATIILKKK